MLRRSYLRPKSKKAKRREGRLHGSDVGKLRDAVFDRSEGQCEMRRRLLSDLNAKYLAGELSTEHYEKAHIAVTDGCARRIFRSSFHMAHLKSRGSGGPDDPANCVASCEFCHSAGDHNYFGSPCPPKPIT